jgi:hypothetical protein
MNNGEWNVRRQSYRTILDRDRRVYFNQGRRRTITQGNHQNHRGYHGNIKDSLMK